MASQTAKTSGARLTSRAVTRSIEAGSTVECAHCGDRVKFQAKVRAHQVICNVYTDGRWDRVEHYHDACYRDAGEPYGTPED
jgi:ribosomal protein L32